MLELQLADGSINEPYRKFEDVIVKVKTIYLQFLHFYFLSFHFPSFCLPFVIFSLSS